MESAEVMRIVLGIRQVETQSVLTIFAILQLKIHSKMQILRHSHNYFSYLPTEIYDIVLTYLEANQRSKSRILLNYYQKEERKYIDLQRSFEDPIFCISILTATLVPIIICVMWEFLKIGFLLFLAILPAFLFISFLIIECYHSYQIRRLQNKSTSLRLDLLSTS